MGQLLEATNRPEEAESLLRRALVIHESALGPHHPTVARQLSVLGGLLLLKNRLAEAEPLLRRALIIDQNALGLEHADFAIDLNNLGQLLLAMNRTAEAERLARQSVETLAKVNRENRSEHPNAQVAYGNYLAILQATGCSKEQAQARLQQILDGASS